MLENEHQKGDSLIIDRDATINVTVSNPLDADDVEIDLFQVFHNMGKTAGFYLWVLVLFVVIGLCVPVIMYQFDRPPLTVSSVVTLDYWVDKGDYRSRVNDLSAPDGSVLDLNQVTSSFVLQSALDGLELPHPITIENLRTNITIQKVLTESSRQQLELLTTMIADKNSAAYEQLLLMELKYNNYFVVTLTNGFGEEDSRFKTNLRYDELQVLLDKILAAYNDYLVETYADLKLPDDTFTFISTDSSDIMQRIDLLNTSVDALYAYCEEEPDDIRAYRSSTTGYSLNDLIGMLDLTRTIDIAYLEAHVQSNAITNDIEAARLNYQYQLRKDQQQLDTLNILIESVNTELANYKNDEVLISSQDSETVSTTKQNTSYYNSLIISQAENYSQAASLEQEIMEIQAKLTLLDADTSRAASEETSEEFTHVIQKCQSLYKKIYDHMDELFRSASYSNYAHHSAAYGTSQGFFSANRKRLMIGAAIGAFLAIMLWGMDALMHDIRVNKEKFQRLSEVNRA